MFKKKTIYKEGFYTNLDYFNLVKGLNKEVIINISNKRKEPKWMLNFRLKSYKYWLKIKEPHWLNAYYKPLNYNNYIYYSSPLINKKKKNKKKIKKTFNKLGLPIKSKKNIAIDAIFDSVSIYTTYKKKLKKNGIIFCSFNEAIKKYPKLVKKYLGTVVPINDNFFASLNSAVSSDGTFIYIPKNIKCPIELSTYFRINAKKTGQFERTMIIADKNSYLSYIEGCSAPIQNDYQLHAAVVEVVLLKGAEVKYSTVQNWFSGNKNKSGILNFVTKRAICLGKKSKMSWTQCETGSAITWKYPSVILKGDYSIGSFFSVSLTNNFQKADTGTKMIHIGKFTKSTIISKGISLGKSKNTYRGLVKINSKSYKSRNFTQCDSMIIGNNCSSHTFPIIKMLNNKSKIEHEATTSKIGYEQLFYCKQRNICKEDAISMIVKGFCKEVFSKLPLEFTIEAEKLLSINLKNKIG